MDDKDALRSRMQMYLDQLRELERSIKMMEDGALRVWHQELGSPKEDVTAAHIAMSRGSVKILQSIVDDIERKLSG